jgi:hypothetical protein
MDEDWRSWVKDPPTGHEFVEWTHFNHRDGLSAPQVNRPDDLLAAWEGKQWNLAAIFWRPVRSADVVHLPSSRTR